MDVPPPRKSEKLKVEHFEGLPSEVYARILGYLNFAETHALTGVSEGLIEKVGRKKYDLWDRAVKALENRVDLTPVFEEAITSGDLNVLKHLLDNLVMTDDYFVKFALDNSRDLDIFKLLFEKRIDKIIGKETFPSFHNINMPNQLIRLYNDVYNTSVDHGDHKILEYLEKDGMKYIIIRLITNTHRHPALISELLDELTGKYDRSVLNDIIDYLYNILIKVPERGYKDLYYLYRDTFSSVLHLVDKFIELGAKYSTSTLLIGVQTLRVDLVKQSVEYATHEDINYAMELLSKRGRRHDKDYQDVFELLIAYGADNREAILKALEKEFKPGFPYYLSTDVIRMLINKGIISRDDVRSLGITI